MKKFLAILMAAVMLLAVVSVGVAEEPTYAKSSEYDASGDAPFTLYFTSPATPTPPQCTPSRRPLRLCPAAP